MLRKEQCFLIPSFLWGFSVFSRMKNFWFYKCLEKEVSLLTGKSKALALELSSNGRKLFQDLICFLTTDCWGHDIKEEMLVHSVWLCLSLWLGCQVALTLNCKHLFYQTQTLFFVLKISLQRTSQSPSARCKTILPPHKPTQPLPIPCRYLFQTIWVSSTHNWVF